jgi:outer membrane protein assembly factor BamB
MLRHLIFALSLMLALSATTFAADTMTKEPTGYTGAATDWYGGGAKMDPGDWPQWRGPTRSGVSAETGLLDMWPEGGPAVAWTIKGCGSGLGTPITFKGRIYLPGEGGGAVFLQCFDMKTRESLWKCRIPGAAQDPGGSASVHGDAIFGQTHDGTNYCIGLDGQLRWTRSIKEFGGGLMNPQYQFAQSPLVDGENVVVNPGGKEGCIVSFDRKTGKTLWQIPASETKGNQPRAAYSSGVITTGGGLKHYVLVVGDGLVGLTPAGKVLWTYNNHRGEANIPTPIVYGDYVYDCNSYGGGTCLLKLSADGSGGVKADKIYHNFGDDYQNLCGESVLVNGYTFTGTGGYSSNPHCYDFLTGKVVWKQGEVGSGVAGLTSADGKLFFRAEGGQVSMIAANPKGYQLLGKFTRKGGGNYSQPIISHGMLIARQNDELVAYDIKKK